MTYNVPDISPFSKGGLACPVGVGRGHGSPVVRGMVMSDAEGDGYHGC